MRDAILVLLLTLCAFTFISCDLIFKPDKEESPKILWKKTFGDSRNDEGRSVQETSDGGYIITGHTFSSSLHNWAVWLIKTDSSGDTLWTKAYKGNGFGFGRSVQQTLDGGYIITGNTYSYSEDKWFVLLIKTDASGNEIWSKTYGGNGGESVQQTSDGGYVIVGNKWDDVWLIKTDASGDILWTKTFGGSENDKSYSGQQTSDGGYIIVGITVSYGAGLEDIWLIKTDELGDTLWTKTFGGIYHDEASSIQQTLDGGYIIVGQTYSYGTGTGVWLIKTDVSGEMLWTRTFVRKKWSRGYSVQQTSDGGYVIVGNKRDDIWLIKTDTFGDILWTKTFGGNAEDIGIDVQQTSDEGYIITGYTYSYGEGRSDVWLIRVAPE